MEANLKKYTLVAGGAGFIGSNLIKYLKTKNKNIIIIDNLSRGNFEFIKNYIDKNTLFFKINLSIKKDVLNIFNQYVVDEIWHLAANSDIVSGVKDSFIDFNDTFLTTYNLVDCSKLSKVKIFNFASSSAVYGDHGNKLLTENSGPLMPISNYGAMKLASEAILSAASVEIFDSVNIFRFPNVVGIPATHGVIFDFINKLDKNINCLEVMGNGKQRKQYLYVDDLISAMIYINQLDKYDSYNIYNIGPKDNGITVKDIAELVCKKINPKAEINYGMSEQGWVGDIPKFRYSINKIIKAGWSPKYSSLKSVKKAISEIYKKKND